MVRTNINKKQPELEKQYNKTVQPITIKVGDKVKYKSNYISSAADNFNAKLAPRYDSVFVVVDKPSTAVCKIQRVDDPWPEPRDAHITHLMHWFSAKSTQPPSLSAHSLNNHFSDNQSIRSLPTLSNNENRSIPTLDNATDMYVVPSLNSSRDRYTRMLRSRNNK
jgi:hypothetical protein